MQFRLETALALSHLLKDLLSGRTTAVANVDIDMNAYIDDDDHRREPVATARDGIWRESSFDLQRGLDVSEEPMDSMPAELTDVFRKR